MKQLATNLCIFCFYIFYLVYTKEQMCLIQIVNKFMRNIDIHVYACTKLFFIIGISTLEVVEKEDVE